MPHLMVSPLKTLFLDDRVWSLNSLSFFSVKFFLFALSKPPISSPLFLPSSFGALKAPYKVKALAWPAPNKKIDINDLL